MTKSTKDEGNRLEPMPAALLAEIFSGGVVVLPHEFAKTQIAEKAETATVILPKEETSIAGNLTAAPLVPIKPKSGEISWLGNFEKRVLVVVNDPTALHINDKDYELLTKILGSVGLSTADIAMVNAATHSLEYNALQEKLPAAVGLYFGIEPVTIGAPIKFPHFQVQPWNNTKFLYAPSISELNGTTPQAIALKKELWTALKKIFN
jgi:hypothetical protein